MRWFWKLLGGRPMVRIDFEFTDHVDGKDVFSFRDRLGRKWLANHAWALFRVTDHG